MTLTGRALYEAKAYTNAAIKANYDEYQKQLVVLMGAYTRCRQECANNRDRNELKVRYHRWKQALQSVRKEQDKAAKVLFYVTHGMKYER